MRKDLNDTNSHIRHRNNPLHLRLMQYNLQNTTIAHQFRKSMRVADCKLLRFYTHIWCLFRIAFAWQKWYYVYQYICDKLIKVCWLCVLMILCLNCNYHYYSLALFYANNNCERILRNKKDIIKSMYLLCNENDIAIQKLRTAYAHTHTQWERRAKFGFKHTVHIRYVQHSGLYQSFES